MDQVQLGKLKHKLNGNVIISIYENGTDILALEFDDGEVFEVHSKDFDVLVINAPLDD